MIVGIFVGVNGYQDITATSYVNGDVDISNKFSQEQFFYSNSSVVFYPTENSESYSFEIDLLKTEGFDPNNKEYKVELNDYELTNATFTGGTVRSNVLMDFYDVDGELACNGEMNLVIRFLSGKTQLILSCPDESSASYFESYFTDYGIRLSVIEIL